MRTIGTEKYYTSTEHLVKVFERESRQSGFKANHLSEFEEWKIQVRKKLCEITGMDTMERCSLEPKLLETVSLPGCKREKMLIQTEPDVWMPVYILIPDGLKENEKRPCVITPHGHGSGGKYSISGRTDIPAIADAIKNANYDYGARFAQEGYIVLCPDARAFGERREWMLHGDNEEAFMNSTCTQLNHMAIGLGQTVTGMWTWDLMRLVDYIETRHDCDHTRIGCAGLSGGGLQTLWLSALDERIRCSVISGYFYGYKDSLLQLSTNCGCNYVPGLWKQVDMGDLGALIAPRPLLIESGDKDPLNGERGIVNVVEQIEISRTAYQLFHAEEKLIHYVFDGPHLWDGQESYPFMKKWLSS